MKNFQTIHITNTDLEKRTDKAALRKKSKAVSFNDSIDYEKSEGLNVLTLHTDYKIDLGKSLPIAEITIVSKFAILQEPLQRQNLEQMIAAHFFHSEAIISRELIKNEFEELFLLPENFLKLDTRCRTILDGG